MEKILQIEKLKGSENYHTWAFAVKNILILKGYETFIETETVAADDESKKSACKAILCLSVEKHIYVHIQTCDTPKKTWNALKDLYEDKGLSRKISLLRNLISTRLEESENMQSYIDDIKTHSAKLTGIGFALSDEWLAAILLAGLTDEYRPFIMGFEASGAKLKSDVIVSKLLDGQTNTDSRANALFSRGKPKSTDTKQKTKVKCAFCKKKGHTVDVCRKKKSEEKPKDGISAKAAFIAHTSANDETETAYAAPHKTIKAYEWYIDSGASKHMTPHGQLLKNIKPTNVYEIMSANSAKMNVKGAGKTTLNTNGKEIVVKEVLHVPALSANLLSVHDIASHGNSVLFDTNGCTIRNANDEIVLQCKPTNGVYKVGTNANAVCMQSKHTVSSYTWHRRLGHTGLQRMKQMRDGAVDGLSFSEESQEIKNCETCAYGKQSRASFGKSERQSKAVLELIHSDIMGPMESNSIGGARYILTFIDDYSRKVFLYFLKAKSDTLDAFKTFKALVENQTERKIKILRTDGGSEYRSKEFDDLCRKNGIQHQVTTAYTPQQNGTAERMNRSIVEKAKCLMFDANLPKLYWAEASNMAAYLINRSISAAHGKVPEEVFTGKRVNLSNLKLFGSEVMVHVSVEKRKKWDRKSNKMIFVGYDEDTKGYRCIDTQTRKLIISRDVIFHEAINNNIMEIADDMDIETTSETEHDDPINDSAVDTTNNETPNDEPQDPDASDYYEIDESEYDHSNDKTYVPDEPLPKTSGGRMTTRSQTGVRPFQLTNFALLAEPNTPTEAMSGRDATKWKAAMDDEIKSHTENNTWSLTKLPRGRKAIKSKWVFKIKSDDEGNVIRHKARLVAKGCAQKFGIDYTETFSPVVRYNSIRYLLAFAVQHDLHIHQMDAVTAFLQGDLEEDIYMEQPEEYQDGTDKVCKLNRSIYGLKQAGRQWNLKLDNALKKFGLHKSQMDPCIYFSSDKGILIAIYVDDFLLFYRDESKLIEMKKYLNHSFKMKDMGPVTSCIGLNIRQRERSIEIDQSGYVEEILCRFEMQESKPVRNPADTSTKLSIEMVTEENSLVGKIPYQEAVGALLYLAQGTRPDIAFAVNNVSRFNQCHSDIHWKAVKRIFRYLRGTTDYKLRYSKSKNGDIIAYSDSDWASDVDKRRSCSGFVITMSGGAICWSSKRQPIVALSSTEAEYIALSATACETIWLIQLANELKQRKDGKAIIHCDNQSAIKLSLSDAYRPRTKHIDIRHHFVRELIDAKTIEIVYISTNQMAADSLTKAVPVEKVELCNKAIGLSK